MVRSLSVLPAWTLKSKQCKFLFFERETKRQLVNLYELFWTRINISAKPRGKAESRMRDRQQSQWVKSPQQKALIKVLSPIGHNIPTIREFDPGSGRTLAACLTHASRAEIIRELALK